MFSRFQFYFFRLSSTAIYVSNQMKQLNNVKQFRKVIDLFNSYIQNDIPTDVIINQTLKACLELKDFQRGIEIHRNLSAQSLNNSSIQYNLIHLYSKFFFR
jgi:anionic cell wall polymer biosynthesis LytR-Cps2A-Psr (LCP) family protein